MVLAAAIPCGPLAKVDERPLLEIVHVGGRGHGRHCDRVDVLILKLYKRRPERGDVQCSITAWQLVFRDRRAAYASCSTIPCHGSEAMQRDRGRRREPSMSASIRTARHSARAQHLLNVLAAVLVRRLEVDQPPIEFVDVRLEFFGLKVELLPQLWQRRQRKPRDSISRWQYHGS